jgi:replicative DNA helicase
MSTRAVRPMSAAGKNQPGSQEQGLPANVAAEKAILGAILLKNSHYQEAAGRIEAMDFSLDAHRRIFLRVGELISEDKSVDIVTLAEQLQRNKELSVIGGAAYLAMLTEGLPRRLSIEEYVRIVKDKSLLRQTILESDRVGVLAGDQAGTAEEVLAEAESAFRRIAGQAITAGLTSVADYIQQHYPSIDRIFDQSARLSGIPSGFWYLDDLTAGFQPQELTILGARPSIGKTAVAGNIAVHVAMSGKTVAFFSLEMPSKALIDRMCCAQGQVDLQAHRQGRLSEVQKQHYLQALAEIVDAPLYIDDQPGQTAASIEAKAARLQGSTGLDLVVVDYLGLMAAERKGMENREQVVAAISRAMKGLAKRLNVPVLLLSQLNRELYKRVDKRPILSDLRESGAIEQDADLVLFLHREDYYNREDPALAGKGELIIAKARNGPLGTVRLNYDARTCRFSGDKEE